MRMLSVRALYLAAYTLWRYAAAMALASLLIACTPEYDWREVKPEGAGMQVLMPARAAAMTQPVNLDGLNVEMTLHGSRVRDVVFTVGAVRLSQEQLAQRDHAVAAMRTAMVRNIGGTERSSRMVDVARIDAAGMAKGSVPGIEVEANGRMKNDEVTLLARFVADGDRVWQAVVLGPQPDRDQARMFLESLKVVRP
jgi:hypothetical protein